MEIIRLFIGIFLFATFFYIFFKGTIVSFKGTLRLSGGLMNKVAIRLARLHTKTSRPMFVFFPEARIRLLDEFGNRVLWIGMGMRQKPKEAYLVVIHEGFAYLMDVSGKYYEPTADLIPYLKYAQKPFQNETQKYETVRG